MIKLQLYNYILLWRCTLSLLLLLLLLWFINGFHVVVGLLVDYWLEGAVVRHRRYFDDTRGVTSSTSSVLRVGGIVLRLSDTGLLLVRRLLGRLRLIKKYFSISLT